MKSLRGAGCYCAPTQLRGPRKSDPALGCEALSKRLVAEPHLAPN